MRLDQEMAPYAGQKRLKVEGLRGLEVRSRRPHCRRQATWSPELAQAVLHLREQYPRWGKDKLVVLLRREGWGVSTSMARRILTRLKAQGVLKEPPWNAISARKRPHPRPYAVRKPKDYPVAKPGVLVQVDTPSAGSGQALDVRPLPGVILKHFTARDVMSRWDAVEVHRQATATRAARFLDTLQQRLPSPVKALQVDGGSEFAAQFEEECSRRGIRLFVLPPRSPKLNPSTEGCGAGSAHSSEPALS